MRTINAIEKDTFKLTFNGNTIYVDNTMEEELLLCILEKLTSELKEAVISKRKNEIIEQINSNK